MIEGEPIRCVDMADLYIKELSPDIMVVLGDRFEILGAAYAAAYHRIPIAHIHGGESTYGAMDDSMRHAISKLSHLHFVANKQFAGVLERMGEKHIFITGAPGLDNLVPILEEGPRKPEKYFVVTYHPETLGNDDGFYKLVEALKQFSDYPAYWTATNNDPGSQEIHAALDGTNQRQVMWSLEEYLRRCRNAACVVGNSSSGIIEAPYLEVPTVDLGRRQEGRLSGRSIYRVSSSFPDDPIAGLITMALAHDKTHRPFDQLYGKPGASKEIAEVIATYPLEDILRKPWAI